MATANKTATCRTCSFFDMVELDDKTRAKRVAVGGEIKGDCKLKPEVVKKTPGDWCGQHPDRRVE